MDCSRPSNYLSSSSKKLTTISSDVNEARTLEAEAEAEAGTLEAEAEAEAKTLEAEAEAEAGNFGLEAEAGFEAGLSHKSKKNFVTHIKIVYYMFHYVTRLKIVTKMISITNFI